MMKDNTFFEETPFKSDKECQTQLEFLSGVFPDTQNKTNNVPGSLGVNTSRDTKDADEAVAEAKSTPLQSDTMLQGTPLNPSQRHPAGFREESNDNFPAVDATAANLLGGTTLMNVIDVAENDDTDNLSSVDKPRWRRWVRGILTVTLALLGSVYVALALAWSFPRSMVVLVVAALVVAASVYTLARHFLSARVKSWTKPLVNRGQVLLDRPAVVRVLFVVSVLAMLVYVVAENWQTPDRLISLAGLAFLLLVSWLLSAHRKQIRWRPVLWGLSLQLLLGLLVLRTMAGRDAFAFLGRQVELFLNYVTAGVSFVFGDKYEDFFFAFKLMPTVIFLSSAMSILYYLGIMSAIVEKIAMLMAVTMGTTAAETVSTAACIFLGQPEASLTIRPYLPLMTSSELHAIMAAGFASVSADIFGLFVSYGISSTDILTAVLMSAPAGLAVSKVIYPETEESQTKTWRQIRKHGKSGQGEASNVLDAAARGAQDAVPMVLTVGATLIAFLSLLAFVNAVVAFLGDLVRLPGLTLEMILSYPLMPVAWLLGVPWPECRVVGELIALKTILNELVGYQRLGHYIALRQISGRARRIATYALCGFSNPTTVGVTLGGLGAMLPQRRHLLARLVLRAWLAGSIACLMTATFAGLLSGDEIDSATIFNTTEATTAY